MAMSAGEDFERPCSGIGHPGMDAPFGTYPTRDGWVTIAMSPFRKLVEVLGAPGLLVYDDPATLYRDRDEIWRRLAAETGKWTRADLIAALLAADIWCGEVKTHLEAVEDPQVRHLGLIASYRHPTAGEVRVVGPAVRLGETPAAIDRPAPLVGQHSREILAGLGRDAADIDRLVEAGIVGVPPEREGRGPAA